VEDAVTGVWSVDDAGKPTSDHTSWLGFQRRTALGLRFERGRRPFGDRSARPPVAVFSRGVARWHGAP